MRRTAALLTTTAFCLLTATACGTTGTPTAATDPNTAKADPTAAATAANVPNTGCPLGVADLSTASGFTFELSDIRKDHQLETQPDVKADVCLYTSPSTPQDAGDPLVLRVDTVTGTNATASRANFERSCTDNSGTLNSSTVQNAKTCTRGDTTIEGNISTADKSIDVYFVNATTQTAATLTRAFDKVLASVS
jgi:hypothetical protein